MNLFSQLANIGLNAKARYTSANVSGTPQIGGNSEVVSLPNADVVYSFDMLLIGAAKTADVDLVSNTEDDDPNPWNFVEGVAQVETATAAGTVSAGGNASVVVTAAGMAGSPKTLAVAVATSDTAAVWAGKVRTALAADSAVAALFTVGGETTAITLTRKPTATFTVGSETINKYAANDGTLNIALATGTATGITTAATSANTTAGVATSGVYAPDCDGKDFEGVAIPAGWDLLGIWIKGKVGDATADLAIAGLDAAEVGADDQVLAITNGTQPAATGNLTITTGSADSVVSVTVLGKL
jgi:hypothetical protein